ncbi:MULTISPECIES: DUF1971 domain-containing protein [unclassified Shewanella]|uniref:DUF1971 domain-containing protein n=1 Tax=unclassified Shewanella TaxID=196818 RepID=UPI00059FA1BC|nr:MULTISPECIES: DUF1971 domain-containing protein [unclassified Shewanella]KIO36399.1 hypothetical protein DB48_10670 [Shewanella sp. cp20]MCG9721261.1 DUF1971 domain-containing protein [Shewanella sp. Isolate7]MCG9745437.1 DUF1971 domain-containing protein [Shewanella sp. Isolate8]
MSFVPKGYVKCKKTPVYSEQDMPAIYRERHFTRHGVYEQIHVIQGELMFFGYLDKQGEVNREVRLLANETAISHPGYWHSIKPLTPDTRFEIHFFIKPDGPVDQA